ncbi:MAG: FGGY family carbohydrate kinase, partial [Candidatus Avispirillum sp.]
KKERPKLLADTRHFLMLPDLFNYWLTGIIHNEYTIATTSNLWDIGRMCWAENIIEYTGICPDAFGEVYRCGQAAGPLKREIASLPALKDTLVVHAASHDTASACYSFHDEKQRAFISAGTWGMTGCVLDRPVLTSEARKQKFANEGAGADRIKFLNNAPCMSVLEACAKSWYPNGRIPWEKIYSELRGCRVDEFAMDLYHPFFRQQEDMPQKVRQYCRDYGLPVPQTEKEIVKTVLSSVAHHLGNKYKALKEITAENFDSVILLGGASRSEVFADFCAQCIDAQIISGDPEASSKGNLYAQKLAFENL